MNPRSKSYIFPLVLSAVFVGILVYFWLRSNDGSTGLPVVKPAPDFTLTNLEGKQVKASDNQGKVVLMEFIFTSCPDICPTTTYKMVQMQEELKRRNLFGDRVRFVAVTFDPETDTPEVLRDYAEQLGISYEGWQLLRGEEGATRDIAASYGITVQKISAGQFAHSVTSLQLIDADQNIRKVYGMGEEMNEREIMEDIDALLAERGKL